MSDPIESRVIEMGKNIVRMTSAAGSGHPSSALSLAHIVGTLMLKEMRYDPADPWNPGSDRLVLSEGHAVPVVYAAYAEVEGVAGRSKGEAKKITASDLTTLREWDSVLDGHPNPAEGFPFFDAATGSLGQGLSVGCGLGLAAKLSGSDKRIFVIIGDGESREGQVFEALDFLIDRKLVNVCPIFNCNGQGQADYVSEQQSAETTAKKLAAFGFDVQVIDGHNLDAINTAFEKVGKGEKPVAIVAQTQKGWGVELLKDKSNHGKPLPDNQVEEAVGMLDKVAASLKIPADAPCPKPPAPPSVKNVASDAKIKCMPFAEAVEKAGLSGALEKNKFSTRRSYGAALLALGHADERIVALDGDVSNSTFANIFAKTFPDRFFECKIAEQNMVSAAAGLQAAGYIPFASTFAKFLARAYDQIEMAAITRANIKLVGSHSGVSLGADGPSQMSLPDMAYFRSYSRADDGRGNPAAVVLHPSDAVAAYRLTELAANIKGITYVRTHRPDVPLIYSQDEQFELGGSKQIAEGDALTVVASGYMVTVARNAVEQLAAAGIKCNLIDAYCLPLKTEPILAAAKKTGGKMLVVEDNFAGGFAATLAEDAALAGEVCVHAMTCPRIPKSGKTGDIILEALGLGVSDVVARVKTLI
jgi:transketolase